jgi:hypothetical protein
MTIQIIFDNDVKDFCKDILFFIAASGMGLQMVHLSLDSLVMPSCTHLFTVCH